MTPPRAGATPGGRSAAPDPRWLALVCCVSGSAGLIFEMVWFHRSGLVFGSSVWATSLVLSSFMGGLTLGSAIIVRRGHRIRRFLRTYAALEVIVAVSGVALTLALPALTQFVVTLTRPAAENLWLTNVVRFVTAFAILLVPSTAMGATLPVLVAALARWRAGARASLRLEHTGRRRRCRRRGGLAHRPVRRRRQRMGRGAARPRGGHPGPAAVAARGRSARNPPGRGADG